MEMLRSAVEGPVISGFSAGGFKVDGGVYHGLLISPLRADGWTPPPIEQLSEDGAQASLWDDDEDWREAESVMDAVTARFGKNLISPASLVGNRKAAETEARGFARDG